MKKDRVLWIGECHLIDRILGLHIGQLGLLPPVGFTSLRILGDVMTLIEIEFTVNDFRDLKL